MQLNDSRRVIRAPDYVSVLAEMTRFSIQQVFCSRGSNYANS